MYVLMKGNIYLTVTNALLQTEEIIFNLEQENYRDSPPVIPAVSAAGYSTGAALALTGSGITATTATATSTPSVGGTSSVLQDDSYSHTSMRPVPYYRTMLRWWDKASPGIARNINGVLVIGDPLIEVSSIKGLFAGQAVSSGTSIPAGAVIQEVTYKVVSGGSTPSISPAIIISKAPTGASASADITVSAGTDGAANLVGQCWLDRFLGWSASAPKRM